MFPEHVDWWTLTLYISLYFWSEKSGHILLCSDLASKSKDSLSAKGKDHGNGMKKEPDSLLDFGANDTANTMSSVNAVKEDKDGNSSDDLDAFFNEMTNEELGDTEKAKSGNIEAVASKQVGDLLTNDQNKKSNAKGDDDEDWGWD